MSRFGLVSRRLKKKSDIPKINDILYINHVYINGDKFKIYKNAEMELFNKFYMYNVTEEKWYELVNKGFPEYDDYEQKNDVGNY